MTLDDPQSPLQHHSPEADTHLPDSQILNFTQSHLPKTLTLDPQIAADLEQVEAAPESESEAEPDLAMSLASPIRPVADSLALLKAASKATSSRRRQKRKRPNRKQLMVIQQKVQILMGNLQLFPFVPKRTLDFASHENLLKCLGLWDFVHVELDNSNLRVDLIAQLVVNYKRIGRLSEVNGVRIKVSRADLGRALKLPPVKKDYSGVVMIPDDDAGFVAEKSIRFIEDLMSDWMLLHDQETWMMPPEVMNWIELIRKGHPDKVEWASLMWFMVEKELSQGIQLVDCYYASHLQHLIKHQNESLFLAKLDEDVNVREDEEEDDRGDVEMVDEVEEHVATTALSEDRSDDKMAFTLSNEHEAVSKDHIDDNMALTLSNDREAVSKDRNVDKEVEEVGIDVNQVRSDEKISEESMSVKDGDANNDTHMQEFNLQIEADKSNDFQDLQNCCPEVKSEEPNIELTLGQDNMEHDGTENDNAQSDNVMTFDDLGLGDTINWQLDERNAEGETFLQPCSLGRDTDSFDAVGRLEEDVIEEEEADDNEEEEEVDEEEEEVDEEEMDDDDYDNVEEAGEDERIDQPSKFDSLQGISSAHMFQGVDISHGAFGSPMSLMNESHLQHFASPAETSSTALGNTLKRPINHEQHMSHRTITDENKRFRSDTWNHQEPSDFYRCMENIEHWMGKAKMMYAAKEQECHQMGMNQQLLYGEMEQRNHMMEHQEKITNEVRQKFQMEIYKLERELFIMGDLLDSYRKALKETRRQFSEYRARYPLLDEPIYKDAGPGGVVLSVAELERQHIKQEEEDKMKRLELESTIKSFAVEWHSVFEGHHGIVQKLNEKLLLLEENMKLLKDLPRKMKTEEILEQPVNMEAQEIPEQPAKMEAEEQPANMKAEEYPEQPASIKAEEILEKPANMIAEDTLEQPANMKAEEFPEQPVNVKAEEIPEQPAKSEN